MGIFSNEWELHTDGDGHEYVLEVFRAGRPVSSDRVYVKRMTPEEIKRSDIGARTIGCLVFFGGRVGEPPIKVGVLEVVYCRSDGRNGYWGRVKCLSSGEVFFSGLFGFDTIVATSSLSTLQLAVVKTLKHRGRDKKDR